MSDIPTPPTGDARTAVDSSVELTEKLSEFLEGLAVGPQPNTEQDIVMDEVTASVYTIPLDVLRSLDSQRRKGLIPLEASTADQAESRWNSVLTGLGVDQGSFASALERHMSYLTNKEGRSIEDVQTIEDLLAFVNENSPIVASETSRAAQIALTLNNLTKRAQASDHIDPETRPRPQSDADSQDDAFTDLDIAHCLADKIIAALGRHPGASSFNQADMLLFISHLDIRSLDMIDSYGDELEDGFTPCMDWYELNHKWTEALNDLNIDKAPGNEWAAARQLRYLGARTLDLNKTLADIMNDESGEEPGETATQ